MTPAETYANEVFAPSQSGALVAGLERRPNAAVAGAVVGGVLGAMVGWPVGAGVGAIAGGLFGYWAAGRKNSRENDSEKLLQSTLVRTDLQGLSAANLMQLRTQVISA